MGWVQLQNQYDNWANSHWNKKGDPRKTVECRECHMPLVDSTDPAAGDALDYNRTPGDRKHRSHSFVAANTLVPHAQRDELPGWERHLQLTEQWLKGELPVPEIADKWAKGPMNDSWNSPGFRRGKRAAAPFLGNRFEAWRGLPSVGAFGLFRYGQGVHEDVDTARLSFRTLRHAHVIPHKDHFVQRLHGGYIGMRPIPFE